MYHSNNAATIYKTHLNGSRIWARNEVYIHVHVLAVMGRFSSWVCIFMCIPLYLCIMILIYTIYQPCLFFISDGYHMCTKVLQPSGFFLIPLIFMHLISFSPSCPSKTSLWKDTRFWPFSPTNAVMPPEGSFNRDLLVYHIFFSI